MLLVQPPIEDFYDTSIRTYPLSLLYLGERIRDISEVTVLDLRTNRKPRPLAGHPFPELEPYYNPHVRTPFSFFGAYYRFGPDDARIREEIERAKPGIVCVSSLFSTYSLEAMGVAQIAKEINGETVTVIGGIHPTLFPRHVLASPSIDYAIRGEGETPLFMLVRALTEGRTLKDGTIAGLCYKEGDGFHIAEPHVEQDIDSLPARRLIDPHAYRIGRKDYTFFLTSRGCPFHCAFCGRPSTPYRKRSLESVERELEDCLDLGIGAIDFEDDMLTLDTRFFRAVLGLFEGRGVTLSAMNGIYSEKLDKATLEDMLTAGFRRLNFSLVDISRPLMEDQKRLFSSNFLGLLPYLEASPYLLETHFIIGLPGQTPDEVLETMLFLMGKRLLAGPSIFYLAPGSPVFDETAGADWEGGLKSMRSSAMRPVNPLLPQDTLFTLMKLTRFINFVKGIVDREPGVKRLSDLMEVPAIKNHSFNGEIVSTLCKDHRFTWYDLSAKALRPEPQDGRLVELFFRRARGLFIRGFKTTNSLVID